MENHWRCPKCGESVKAYRNPFPTVDALIFVPACGPDASPGVVLIERVNPPHGWALPGGFVDYGESCEHAAIREAKEETGLDIILTGLLGVYSSPDRDPRFHTMSTVYTAVAGNMDAMAAGDDAGRAQVFPLNDLPKLAFDHAAIMNDFMDRLKTLNPDGL